MSFLIRLLLSAIAFMLAAYLLPGVHVDDFLTALVAAIVLAILNALVKPVFILLTIPITFITLGLFLLVINALIILLVDLLVPGFRVDGFWWALLFSIILSLIIAIFDSLSKK
jgi:putative membrane protein